MSEIKFGKSAIKRVIYKLINPIKFRHIKKQFICKKRWYGNEYGGFYLNPDLITNGGEVYSFGAGEDVSFDLALINKHNSYVTSFDPTPKSIEWIRKQKLPQNFTFLPFGVAKESGNVKFNLPRNQSHVSGSVINHGNVSDKDSITVEMKSIVDIIKLLGHEHVDLIKMDIEGSEYEVVDEILRSSIIVNQFAIEIHERFFDDGVERTKSLIKSMNKNGYLLFGISDSYEEISFIREDF